jgi:hypothetical protein
MNQTTMHSRYGTGAFEQETTVLRVEDYLRSLHSRKEATAETGGFFSLLLELCLNWTLIGARKLLKKSKIKLNWSSRKFQRQSQNRSFSLNEPAGSLLGRYNETDMNVYRFGCGTVILFLSRFSGRVF